MRAEASGLESRIDMTIRFTPRPKLLQDLAAIRDFGADTLGLAIEGIRNQKTTLLRPEQLRRVLSDVIADQQDKVDLLLRPLLSFYALRRNHRLSVDDVLEGFANLISQAPDNDRWTDEELVAWKAIEPQLRDLLDLEQVWMVAKAVDLAYEYANLFESGRIVTDIRPVFDAEGSSFSGAIVTYTLRLNFDNREGEHSISFAMDENDITRLKEECARALSKGHAALEHMLKGSAVAAIIVGSEDDESK